MPNDALKITPSFFLTDEALKRLGLWSSLFFFCRFSESRGMGEEL